MYNEINSFLFFGERKEKYMENNDSYSYTKIREDIWQIAEDSGVYCTLIKGKDLAILVDTGFGHRNLRTFVEKEIETPYMVINSHGHPDHIGGNHWFDDVYAVKEEWDVISHFEGQGEKAYELKEIEFGREISLGNMHVQVVSLPGHTKGSIGVLVQEEKLLVAGDALNQGLWLFNYGSLSMQELLETLQKVVQMDFDTYLCGHSTQEYSKKGIFAHIRNIDQLKLDECTRCNTIGFDTYCSSYKDDSGISDITFTIDKIN